MRFCLHCYQTLDDQDASLSIGWTSIGALYCVLERAIAIEEFEINMRARLPCDNDICERVLLELEDLGFLVSHETDQRVWLVPVGNCRNDKFVCFCSTLHEKF